ncbi:MAG: hypothetical protein QOH12_3921 [Solirubrobacteraceae bacterium]|jgi:hypothetical protein|nr:hypothetical protein [Solirubrobacteraceae bacterium]
MRENIDMVENSTVADRFAHEVLDRVRRTHLPGAGVETAVALSRRRWRPTAATSLDELTAYVALCERAWLYWSRSALDFVTINAMRTAWLGIFEPSRVRNADDAAAAQSMCGYHRTLLNEVPRDLNYPVWPFRLERARRVLLATQEALGVAVTLDTLEAPALSELHRGIG